MIVITGKEIDRQYSMWINANNPTFMYIVMGTELVLTTQDRVLGVVTDTSVETSMHCSAELKKR